MKSLVLVLLGLILNSCGSFKAERVDGEESDKKALKITDEWVAKDTEKVISEVIDKLNKHKGFKRYLRGKRKTPKVFIGEIQNLTSEAYFPINDINDEFLNEISATGQFTLIDADARESVLKEIQYQNDGMVNPKQAKTIGRQSGADLMIFGNVYMKPARRDGKTIKQYALNLRMTDIENGEEVMRTRVKLHKYSKKSKYSW